MLYTVKYMYLLLKHFVFLRIKSWPINFILLLFRLGIKATTYLKVLKINLNFIYFVKFLNNFFKTNKIMRTK